MQSLPTASFLAFSTLLLAAPSQNAAADHRIGVRIGSVQIRDGLNYGIVFDGGQLHLSYEYTLVRKSLLLRTRIELGGGALTDRGMLGFGAELRPIDGFVGFRLVDHGWKLYLGPQLLIDYRVQFYPDLQTGQSLWSTTLGIGPEFLVQIPHKANRINVGLEYTLLGAMSRPEARLPPYFYSLSIGGILSNLHSKFVFASPHNLARGALVFEYVFERGVHDVTLGYRLDLTYAYQTPELVQLAHTLGARYQL
jgi:hypothetical protein